MGWRKQGVFYVPRRRGDWMVSHAQLPTVDLPGDGLARIYFGTRDAFNHTVTTYIEVKADDPREITYEHDAPVLARGELGSFDDGGAMPSCIVNKGGMKLLYYIGWNAGVTVSYRNSIGLAVSDDGGKTFTRLFRGPIMDRTRDEPHFVSAPWVMLDQGVWRMWYLGGVRWEIIDERPEPIYHIRYAESHDGVEWERRGVVCIDLKGPEEGGVTRPVVRKENGVYRMWYARRGRRDYRTNRRNTYRIGYAESADGIEWERKDDQAGIDVSEDGWDSEMVAFGIPYESGGRRLMLYNGNGFGASGIGYAVWEEGD